MQSAILCDYQVAVELMYTQIWNACTAQYKQYRTAMIVKLFRLL